MYFSSTLSCVFFKMCASAKSLFACDENRSALTKASPNSELCALYLGYRENGLQPKLRKDVKGGKQMGIVCEEANADKREK